MLQAQITNFSYQKCYEESLQRFDFGNINAFDINALPSENLESFIAKHNFSNAQINMLRLLNLECTSNNFEIWINNE